MLLNKTLKIIWYISFILALVGIIATESDTLCILPFAIVSGILFTVDYLKYKSNYVLSSNKVILKRRWHIVSNVTQWVFWVCVLYVPLVAKFSIGYKVFILVDLFIVSTFVNYKYRSF